MKPTGERGNQIIMNFRGEKIPVTNSVLNRMPFFKVMLLSGETEIRLDRSKDSFLHIMDFLLYGSLYLTEKKNGNYLISKSMINKIKIDSILYGVDGLVEELYSIKNRKRFPLWGLFKKKTSIRYLL
jgi:hypothetical protein